MQSSDTNFKNIGCSMYIYFT